MATPSNVTTKAASGKYMLNKSLSDSPDEILRLQGVSWFKRRAVSLFSLTLHVKHTTDESGVEHFVIDQVVSGVPVPSEVVVVDGVERDQEHFVFGLVTAKSSRISAEEITDQYLKEGLTQDAIDDGIFLTESWSTPEKNTHAWRNVQMWGFYTVNKERRYVTKVTFTSPEKRDGPIYARFVYDYIGPM